MPNYIRNRVPGGTYFFAVCLEDRSQSLLTDRVESLRAAVAKTRAARPFHIDAWVVLPDHTHCIWTLPPADTDYSGRMWKIKMHFAKSIAVTEPRTPTHIRRGERGIWQRRFWEHTIRDEDDYAAHMDYTHFNPVKHGLAGNVSDWPFSSFRRCVALGLYPPDWAGVDVAIEVAGERD